MKRQVFTFVGVCCLVQVPLKAQNITPNAPVANASAPSVEPMAPSITAHLQMSAQQTEQLSRIYESYAARRRKHESEMARLHAQLQVAQSPTVFDGGKANRLLREMNLVQQEGTTNFLKSRGQALKVLTPIQRSQLESIATDSRLRVSRDPYYELLLLRVEEVSSLPPAGSYAPATSAGYDNRNNHRRDRGSESYGVYGGYRYGYPGYGYPDYGVYGSYSQGSVGVHVGVGRGGPSIGVGIGRVFGGIFGGRY